MRLTIVALSVGLLGFASPVLYANDTTTSTTTTKHNHHSHTTTDTNTVDVGKEYKDLGALPPQPETDLPRLDIYQTIFDTMNQNAGRSKPMPDWFNRIGLSGGANFDVHMGNRSMGYEGENTRRISLNDTYINAQIVVNDWARAFTSLDFENTSIAAPTALTTLATSPKAGRYSYVYNNSATINSAVRFEQGYVTLGNSDVTPIFLQFGKEYNSFGKYQIHAIHRPMSQVLSESLQTSMKLGFITRLGLHGDISLFDNSLQLAAQSHTKTVYGASLGFDQINDQFGFDVGVSYLSQLTGVNDVAYAVTNFRGANTFTHTVGGVALYGDLNAGPFTLAARYTTAIQSFSPADLSTQYNPPVTPLATTNFSGARPWAADVTAGFGYNYWAKNQNVYLSFEASNEAVNLYLPKTRWVVGYNIDIWKYTNVGAEYLHDKDYSSGNGGSGKSSNEFALRASVKFG